MAVHDRTRLIGSIDKSGISHFVRSRLKIAKDCDCKFYFGSDAHHPILLDAAKVKFERMVDELDLSEDDKSDQFIK